MASEAAGLVIEISSSSESESVRVGEYHTESVRGGSGAHWKPKELVSVSGLPRAAHGHGNPGLVMLLAFCVLVSYFAC